MQILAGPFGIYGENGRQILHSAKLKPEKKIVQYLDYSESIAKAFVFHQTSRNLFTIQKLRYFSIIFDILTLNLFYQ